MSVSAFLSAVQFLTILPVKSSKPFNADGVGFFPLVGMMLGGICAITFILLPDSIAAFGFLLLLSILSGGLHLDGLADSADAYMASHKAAPSERKSIFLRVAKEPTSGPIAIITLVLILLGKWLAINTLGLEGLSFIVVAVAAARIMPLLIFYKMKYARESGFALEIQKATNLSKTWIISAIPLAIAQFFIPFSATLTIVFVFFLVLLLHKKLINPIIGGFTGDTIGASIEVTELLLLLMMVGYIDV